MKKSVKDSEPLKKEHKSMDDGPVLDDPLEMVLQNEKIREMLKVNFIHSSVF